MHVLPAQCHHSNVPNVLYAYVLYRAPSSPHPTRRRYPGDACTRYGSNYARTERLAHGLSSSRHKLTPYDTSWRLRYSSVIFRVPYVAPLRTGGQYTGHAGSGGAVGLGRGARMGVR